MVSRGVCVTKKKIIEIRFLRPLLFDENDYKTAASFQTVHGYINEKKIRQFRVIDVIERFELRLYRPR